MALPQGLYFVVLEHPRQGAPIERARRTHALEAAQVCRELRANNIDKRFSYEPRAPESLPDHLQPLKTQRARYEQRKKATR